MARVSFRRFCLGTGLQVSSCIGTYDGIISNAFSVSGNQLYHAAALLMLQKKPRSMARKSVSFVYFLILYRVDEVYFTEVHPLACASNLCHLYAEHPSVGEPLWQ